MNKIKVVILGSGFGQKVITPAIEKIEDFEIVRGYDCSNVELLSKDKSVDAVILAVPPFVQGKIAPLLKNKHLFLEKPLSANLNDALKIQDSFKNSDKKIMVDFGFRFVDSFQKFRYLLQNKIKDIQFIEINWLLNTRNDDSLSWNWKSNIKMGGGTMNLMGSHVLDYIYWMFGDIESVVSQKTALIKTRFDIKTNKHKNVTADDTCQLLLKLKNGVPVTVSLSTALSTKTPHSIKVWCKNGFFELNNNNNSDYYNGFNARYDSMNKLTIIRNDFEQNSRFDIIKKALTTFAGIICGEKLEYSNLEDGIKVQRLLKDINGF